MPVAKKKHASSWTRNPRVVTITPKRIEALKLLTRYKYLRAPYFSALLGGNLTNWREVLRELYDGGLIDRPVQQRHHDHALSRPRAYEITDAGLRVIRNQGGNLWHGSKSFPHELMASELMASFEIGAKENGIRLLTWPDIRKSDNVPEATKTAPKPYAIPVEYQGTTYMAEADGLPMGFERIIEEQKHYYFCPGIEADRNTEGLKSGDFKRSSLYKKFTLYLEIERQRLFRSHFGFPNMVIPFFTINAQHLENMKERLYEMTKGKGSKSILFCREVYPDFDEFHAPLSPSGFALTATYDRVGYEPFKFLE